MRSEEEINALSDALDNVDSLEFCDDKFKYGYHCGKMVALAWVLSDKFKTGDLQMDLDFEDWQREGRDAAEEIIRRLRGEQ